MAKLWPLVWCALLIRTAFPRASNNHPGSAACSRLVETFQVENGTLVYAKHIQKANQVPLPGIDSACQGGYTYANATVDLCRVLVSVNTTESSQVLIEGWLPDHWNHRLLASGGGGIAGCIDYGTLQYGVQLGFATFGTNSGHNGTSGLSFLHKPEVLNDFGYRAIHVQAVVAKSIIDHYYGSKASYSYYNGCSTGGRQAFATALWYPQDFDGLLAGSPGINWLRIVAQRGILAKRIGWPNIDSPAYISQNQWQAIRAAQIRIYDSYDGVTDGVIDDPTKFHFNPEVLRCGTGLLNESLCLTNDQIDGARAAYHPVANSTGSLVYPAFELGAPTEAWSFNVVNNTPALRETILQEFWRGAVFNDTTWNATEFTEADMDLATKIDPGRINTWDPNLSAFHKRGGKILSYHGRADDSIPTLLSVEYYNWVQKTLNLTTSEMQSFYRTFFVPGLHHCSGGEGSWFVGQQGSWSVPPTPIDHRTNSSQHDALLALVNWTENGTAPATLIGTKFKEDKIGGTIQSQRLHCVYPNISRWNGFGDTTVASSWYCDDKSV